MYLQLSFGEFSEPLTLLLRRTTHILKSKTNGHCADSEQFN